MKTYFKSFSLDDCTLSPTRIDIWQYSLRTPFNEARAILNSEELTRAHRYHFEKHRRRFIIARTTLRLILARYSAIAASDLEFVQNQYGKPTLLTAPHLEFNLSHSGDLALLAVGSSHPMGIDLEFFSDRPINGIGDMMFSTAENKALNTVHYALKSLAFFHIWAQKEAFIKACGLGLSYPTKQFDVPALPSTNEPVFDALHHQQWMMTSFHPTVTCCAALCRHPSVTEVRYLVLDDHQHARIMQ